MDIKTTFAIGDSVWSILKGRAHGFEIKGICLSKDNVTGRIIVKYTDSKFNDYPENQCFLSKEELRDYFMGGE